MSLSAAAAGPAGGLHTMALHAYKDLLRKYSVHLTASAVDVEEGATWVKETKNRMKDKMRRKMLEKLEKYRLRTATLDPIGAFRRLGYRMELLRGGALSSASATHATTVTASLSEREAKVAEVIGPDGPLRDFVVSAVMQISRAFMSICTNTKVSGAEELSLALERPDSVPLITVSNHVAALDDPLLISAILPEDQLNAEKARNMRWTMCAADRCFNQGALLSSLFRAAKVLKTERGLGLSQPAMWAAEDLLARGEWVHVFPEGTRSKDGGRTLGRLKWGVGRLVASCAQPPVVLPFIHKGMEKVMPRGRVVPRLGEDVELVFGKPVHVEDLWSARQSGALSDEECYAAVATRIQYAMAELKSGLDGHVGDTLPVDFGVDQGVLGEREFKPRWWWRVTSHRHGFLASPVAGFHGPAGLLEEWSEVLARHARLLGHTVDSKSTEAGNTYAVQQSEEILRILRS